MELDKKLSALIEELNNFEVNVTSYLNDPDYKEDIENDLYPKIKNLKYYLDLANADKLVKKLNKLELKTGNAPYILEDIQNGAILEETRVIIYELKDSSGT